MIQTPKAAIPAEINNESALSICVPFQGLAQQERWLVAGQLQDSAPAVVASLSIASKKPRLLERDVTKPVTVGFGA